MRKQIEIVSKVRDVFNKCYVEVTAREINMYGQQVGKLSCKGEGTDLLVKTLRKDAVMLSLERQVSRCFWSVKSLKKNLK
jgi:hypothetical protein